MKKLFFVFILVALGSWYFLAYGLARQDFVIGKQAADFRLQDLNHEIIQLADFKAKEQPLLVFFWTTWCPFCQKEIRILSDYYGTLAKAGVDVLAVNVGESYSKVNSFLRGFNLPFRVLLDKDSKVAESYFIRGVPTYVLMNKRGDIVFLDNKFPTEFKELLKD